MVSFIVRIREGGKLFVIPYQGGVCGGGRSTRRLKRASRDSTRQVAARIVGFWSARTTVWR